MTLPIRLWPDPVLKTVAEPVTDFGSELARLADEMLATMYDAPGRGLAAPQVGLSKRLFVMDVTWKEGERSPIVMVNPVITWSSKRRSRNAEGCLSLPGFALNVSRPVSIDMEWQDTDGKVQRARLRGMASICAQHEYDHLDGVLTLDRAAKGAVREVGPVLAELEAKA